jgi:two-component system sensor histidine kinase DesK
MVRSKDALAPVLARLLLTVVFAGFGTIALLRILTLGYSVPLVILAVALITAECLVQVLYFARLQWGSRSRWRFAALGAQALLVYLPMLVFQESWIALPGFLAGSALIALPIVPAAATFAAVVVSVAIAQTAFTGSLLDVAYSTLSAVITGLLTFGLTRLATMVLELHRARTELARLAVEQERLRFARDVHDLLGYSLSAITLKTELTRRLLRAQPARAEQELTEVLDLSRKALADVRSVAAGVRQLSLDDEIASARSVLEAASIEVTVEGTSGDLSLEVSTVLATVLRESVTNVLRHSDARCCGISLAREGGAMRLDVRNDGLRSPQTDDEGGGAGIGNLAVRLGAVGGVLSVGPQLDRTWLTTATVPLASSASAPAAV